MPDFVFLDKDCPERSSAYPDESRLLDIKERLKRFYALGEEPYCKVCLLPVPQCTCKVREK